jgi:hypothetical protein
MSAFERFEDTRGWTGALDSIERDCLNRRLRTPLN